MGVKERVFEFINSKNISIKQFEERCSLSNGYVSSMRKGFGSIKLDNVLREFPDVNRDWLIYGEGEMLKDPERSSAIGDGNTKRTELNTVLLLPLSAQGGTFNDFVMSVRESDCERIISPIKGADYAMSITGDSMYPEYPSGSKVLIKKINERAFIEWGRCYVLDTCNGTVIKKIMPSDDNDRIKCVSINAEYPPFEVDASDIYGMYRVMMLFSEK